MKYIITNSFVWMLLLNATAQVNPLQDTSLLEPVELIAVRAGDNTPVAKTNLNRKEIQENNLGQDIPFIINHTPSVVVNSDAGNGIGYTGIRIRGTDASRVNVTVNGIPYNDAESQGTFFVDIPDFASSLNSIQVQRGVGTSSNGSGSFGGTINLGTNDLITKKSMELNNTFGSYGSFKNSLNYNSGLIGRHLTATARLSYLRSDGYIDRASSRLKSFFTSIGYVKERNSLRMNIFSGKEKTYQAWNGIDEATLKTNRRYNSAGTEREGEPYDNETDNYTQTHYQLFYNHKISSLWKASIALFLTKGKGYYEQYKAGEGLSDYGLPEFNNGDTLITATNLIRQLWLDNDFYGSIFSFHYKNDKTNIIIGGGWNQYKGKHFGQIISADAQIAVPLNYKWYDVDASKTDASLYTKWTENISNKWQTYIDLQVRSVNYTINGFRENPAILQSNEYFFFNPKAGITYANRGFQAYLSYGHAAKEPNRDDFESQGTDVPRPEKLDDIEIGFQKNNKANMWGINFYYMTYKDQLVLTGKINDVGAYTRSNIKNSFRVGTELQGAVRLNKWVSLKGNLTLSTNKIKSFTEFIDDYDNGGQQERTYSKTDLPFSPSAISSTSIDIVPFKKASLSIISKYVSRQYLDNTSMKSRSLDPYFVQDLRLTYQWEKLNSHEVKMFIHINNIYSALYEANGYTFSYISGNKLNTENYYFPMATINILAGVNFKL
jgi:iron complex outermembrane receptor protein